MTKYFLGKVCTVFTNPTNRNFKEENSNEYPKQIYNYFVGVVEEIHDDGILLNHGKTKTFFFFHSIIGVAEETILDENNPEDAAAIEKIKAGAKPVVPVLAPADNNFIDVNSLKMMGKN